VEFLRLKRAPRISSVNGKKGEKLLKKNLKLQTKEDLLLFTTKQKKMYTKMSQRKPKFVFKN
jgi:hypothetical protein